LRRTRVAQTLVCDSSAGFSLGPQPRLKSVPLLEPERASEIKAPNPKLMLSARSNRITVVAALLAVLLGAPANLWARAFEDPTGGGTIISNRAEASYQDDAGERFTTVSPTVIVTVLAVAAIVVTPDETAPSDTVAPREQVTRLFRVCNSGNSADTFTLTRAAITAPATLNALYFDNDGSGTLNAGDAPI